MLRPTRQLIRPWWFWTVLLGFVLAALYVLFPLVTHGQSKTRPVRDAGPRPIPVVAVAALKQDMPVYLTGLGTVTALQTVTIKSRVDGQLIKIAFREGQFVRKGDLLVEVDPRPFQVQLDQAEAQAAKDQAALNNARRDLERYQVLVEQNSIARQQLDTQAASVTQDEGVLKSDRAQIDNARLNLTYSKMTAPVSGRVGLRLVDVGNMVHAADPNGLVVITQVRPIALVFTLPEDTLAQFLPKVRAGEPLPVDAYDRNLEKRLTTGRLLSVDNQIDQSTGTVKLKAEFANPDETLFPNEFVNARLLVDTLHNTVTVPTAAVQHAAQSTFVFVVKPGGTVEMRDVVVRLTEGDQAAIARGVSAGEIVVTDGLDKLQAGVQVSVRRGDAKPVKETGP